MSSKWTQILLAVSVAFNLLFLVGYAGSKEPAPQGSRFERRAKRWAGQLNLNQQQNEAFERLLAQTVEERERVREENRPKRELLLAELIKDEPDEKVLLEFAQSDIHQSRRELMVRYMKNFVAILTPEQRQEFVDSIRSRWAK